MGNIDRIMDLLDWNRSAEDQALGIELAKDVQFLHAFLQPCMKKYNKNVWDNCAKILAMRPDEELEQCLPDLLEWLQDLNWPGAIWILERLQAYRDTKTLDTHISIALQQADRSGDEVWRDNLLELSASLHAADGREAIRPENESQRAQPPGRRRGPLRSKRRGIFMKAAKATVQGLQILALLCMIVVSLLGVAGEIMGYGWLETALEKAGIPHGFDLLWDTGMAAVLLLLLTYGIKRKFKLDTHGEDKQRMKPDNSASNLPKENRFVGIDEKETPFCNGPRRKNP